MKVNVGSPLWGANLRKMLKSAKKAPDPDLIGTFMGRDALAVAVSSLDLGVEDTVLLPSYLCREVVKPFLGKTRVEYYAVGHDLTVDPDVIRLNIGDTRIKLMMIINYFGFLQPYRSEIKRMCADNGIVLMEDCAHSLLTEGSGEVGDVCIFSFRKILPLPDGGGLRMSMGKNAVTPVYYPKIYSNVLSTLIILKSLLTVRAEIFSRAGLTSRKKCLAPANENSPSRRKILPLSSYAFNGIANSSFSEISERRRRDYQFWQKLAEETNSFTPVFSHLPLGVCPLGYPIRVKERDRLKYRLQEQGIFLKIHWHLPEVIGKEFVNSHKLSKSTITLPVYPELVEREREAIVGALIS
jgi:perosamine synthetase